MRTPRFLVVCLLVTFWCFSQSLAQERGLWSYTQDVQTLEASDGATIAYSVVGQGPPVLFLHGFLGNMNYWFKLTEPLRDDFTMVMVDLRGHGFSTNPKPEFDYRDAARDVVAVMTAEGFAEFGIVGHSAGGILAYHVSSLYPEHVGWQVVIGSPPMLGPDQRERFANWPAFDDLEPWLREVMLEAQPGGRDQIERLLDDLRRYGSERDDLAFDSEKLSTIATPTLVVWGDREDYPIEMAAQLFRDLPNASLWVVPGVGHQVFWPKMEGSALAAREFVERIRVFAAQYSGAEHVSDDHDTAGALADIHSFTQTSQITGRTYAISVALPLGYRESEADYGVLYAVDANGEFGTVTESARLLAQEGSIPNLIVVGIGYPVGQFWNAVEKRVVDLTPVEDREIENVLRELGWPEPEGSGGGPGFLRFLLEELAPRIEADYRASAADRALFGHSLGGLFAIYALLTSDGAFRKVIAGSPALAWEWDVDAALDTLAEAEAAGRSLDGRLFLAAGELESPAVTPEFWPIVEDALALSRALEEQGVPGLLVETHIFPGETHNSVIPGTISRGLRFIYPDQ